MSFYTEVLCVEIMKHELKDIKTDRILGQFCSVERIDGILGNDGAWAVARSYRGDMLIRLDPAGALDRWLVRGRSVRFVNAFRCS